VKPDVFGARRCVVKLTFTDQPDGTQHWWFINDGSRAELCVEEPGFEVDLYLVTTAPDTIYIYRGDLSLARALAKGRLEAHGAAWARRALSRWLAPSPWRPSSRSGRTRKLRRREPSTSGNAAGWREFSHPAYFRGDGSMPTPPLRAEEDRT
jgi:hypothetical protein